MSSVRAYIGLGANVGNAVATLTDAVHALAALPDVRLIGVSRLYITAPVEVVDQPDFHNAVVALDVPARDDLASGAVALLVQLKGLEKAFGRQDRFRYGPRELDLDLLMFGDDEIRVERPPEGESLDPAKAGRLLEVPPPEARPRRVVLAPLADLAPDCDPPGWGETVAEALRRQSQVEDATGVRAVADWDRLARRWR